MTVSKSNQRKLLRAQLEAVGIELAAARERLAELERRGVEISSKLAHIEVHSRGRSGNPGPTIMRVAWKDFQRLTWRHNGVTTDDIYESLRAKVPRLRKATLRVYLHRFRDKELIVKRDGLWHRSTAEESNQA
jgi:hypothetical protein